jgi:homoserine dehydrogenase
VLGDLLGVLATTGTGFLQHDGYYRSLPLLAPGDHETALYVRLTVADRPGVLAQVANVFGGRGVSIESVVQRPGEPGTATLVLLTHVAREDAAFGAIDETAALDLSREAPRVLRVLSG